MEAKAHIQVLQETIEERQWIDENRPEAKRPGGDYSLGWHRPVDLKARLELLMEVFDGHRAGLVQNLADFDPVIRRGLGLVLAGERSHPSATWVVA